MGSQQSPWWGQAEMHVGDTRWSSLFLVPQPCRPLKPLKAPLSTFTKKEMVSSLVWLLLAESTYWQAWEGTWADKRKWTEENTEEKKQTEARGLTSALLTGVETTPQLGAKDKAPTQDLQPRSGSCQGTPVRVRGCV